MCCLAYLQVHWCCIQILSCYHLGFSSLRLERFPWRWVGHLSSKYNGTLAPALSHIQLYFPCTKNLYFSCKSVLQPLTLQVVKSCMLKAGVWLLTSPQTRVSINIKQPHFMGFPIENVGKLYKHVTGVFSIWLIIYFLAGWEALPNEPRGGFRKGACAPLQKYLACHQ